ncbi:MAG: HAD family acid phosphatase [Janthinobacterium lividum]
MPQARVISVGRVAAVIWLSGSLAAAQTSSPAPVVPIDHFGPPMCPGVHTPAHRMTVEAATAEQEQGAVLEHALPSAEPLENFALDRYRLADYGDCVGSGGCYWADLDAQYRRAELALEAEITRHKTGEKLALVMDIDETSLSSYCEMKREDFGYLPSLTNVWVVSPEAAVGIPGGVRLVKKAEAAGVAVFFLTGRPGKPEDSGAAPVPDQTAATARNLEGAGYHGWTGLLLRNGAENGIPTIEYKSRERRKIVERGYTILLSVGDQWSDLLGTPQAEVSVKLPNPFYFIP